MTYSTPTEVARTLFLPGTEYLSMYGGSRIELKYLAGTVTVTNGSLTLAGSGTSWLGNVDAGMILHVATQPNNRVVVGSVESDTSLTLVTPWSGTTAAGVTYMLAPALSYSYPAQLLGTGLAYVTNAYGRLVIGRDKRVVFSAADNPLNQATDDYHELPEGSLLTGLRFASGLVYVFTTSGTWGITNMAYDLTDDAGNAQQTLELLSRDLILWDEKGIASWDGNLVVPAVDDVRIIGKEGAIVTGGARKLYREYVEAGYQPGQAAVHRGHYFLPILNGTTAVDQLVWRLDRLGTPFVRWAGHAGTARSLTIRAGSTTRQPKLLAVTAQRIVDHSAALQPSSTVKNDATGTAHQLKITSRSIMLSETIDHTLRFGRLRYELDDAASDNPTFTAEWSRGRPGSSFTALTGSASEGEDTFTWSLAKAGQQTRMRFTSNNAASKAVVRAMEFKVRQHGRT